MKCISLMMGISLFMASFIAHAGLYNTTVHSIEPIASIMNQLPGGVDILIIGRLLAFISIIKLESIL